MKRVPGKQAVPFKEKGNIYNRLELAGAFGDLSTLVPFVLAYVSLLNFNPAAVLFGFGLTNIVTGMFYKTPIPVQPMKAIGTIAAAHAGKITPGMVWGAGLFSGAFWLILASTGATKYIMKLVKKPVVKGIVLGLGISFLAGGFKMMAQAPLIALIGLVLIVALRNNQRIPAILALLLFGAVTVILVKPGLMSDLAGVRPSLYVPSLSPKPFTLTEFLQGAVLLALPQIPVTLGNGIIALTAENNELFPARPVTVRQVALSTAIMNLISPFTGGIPLCHGAGGMAAHVRFGARTGGATVILGLILLGLALFFGRSLPLLLQLFPPSVLGVVMFLAGVELASSALDYGQGKKDIILLVVTAGLALWNAGAALLAGIILSLFFASTKRLKDEKNQ